MSTARRHHRAAAKVELIRARRDVADVEDDGTADALEISDGTADRDAEASVSSFVPRKAGGARARVSGASGKPTPRGVRSVGRTHGGRSNERREEPISGDASTIPLSSEESFLRSTSPLPRSVYGRLRQLSDAPGFPRTPPVVLTTRNPKAYVFRNFLSAEECEHLIRLATERLAPSTVVGTGGPVSSDIRTSAGTFLAKAQDDVVRSIELRMAAAARLPEPNGEGMQILRYDVGQKYDPHFDYFHDQTNASPKRGGQRMATMLAYLADTERGGETIFPEAKKPRHFDDPDGGVHEWSACASRRGVPVQSKRGDAVLFWSLTDAYALDPGSLHGACPVLAGSKWTAVKWMRVARFDGGFPEDARLPMPSLSVSRRDSDDLSLRCQDEWEECADWASRGWCTRNPEFMIGGEGARDSKGPACPRSCDVRCS